MIFKRRYVRKHLMKALKKVVVPRTTSDIQNKKERVISRRLVAIQLASLLLCISIITIMLANFYKKEPANTLIPEKTNDLSNIIKLPKSEAVNFFDTGTRHNGSFYDYPDINYENMTQQPVYKYINDVDTEKLLNTLLDYFSIDREIYEIKVKKIKHSMGNGHTLDCLIMKDSKAQASIEITSTGRVILTIEDIEESSINFNYNPPDDTNEEALSNYIMDYIDKNSDIIKIKTNAITVDFPYPNSYRTRIYENKPTSDIEKLLDYNNIGNYVAFYKLENRVWFSLRYNEVREFIGEFPNISSTQAVEKFRNKDIICYDSRTKEQVEKGISNLTLSSEDKVLKTWLTYAVDENDYIRPVYEIALRAENGYIYYVAVDAIEKSYIQ